MGPLSEEFRYVNIQLWLEAAKHQSLTVGSYARLIYMVVAAGDFASNASRAPRYRVEVYCPEISTVLTWRRFGYGINQPPVSQPFESPLQLPIAEK